MTGNGSIEEIANAHKADLNLIQCHRSINYVAEMIEKKYGAPWIKVNFIGIEAFSKSLRDIAKYFGDTDLMLRTEQVIMDETSQIEEEIASYKELLNGKTAVLFVGGSRAHHYQGLLREIGIETLVAGYEFGHRDDYEGRDVIPYIKVDADSRNIEELHVEKDEKNYSLRIPASRVEQLKEELPWASYDGLIKEMKDGSLIIDDLNHFETEKIIEIIKPEFFGSGIKDKYIIQKMGVYSKQMHSYDYSGPYAGFKGALNFGRDVAAGILTPAWSYITAPWNKEPILNGIVEGVEKVC
jgi:nitrogenase molybdenum-iron protein alpha chain